MNFDYCQGNSYVIREGDTLYSLSRRYNVPLALILRANPYVDIYNLQIGDELCIPVSDFMGPGPVIPGEGAMPLPSQGAIGSSQSQPVMPVGGAMPLPSQGAAGNSQSQQPVMPVGEAMPLPSQGAAGNSQSQQPVMPVGGAMPLPSQGFSGNQTSLVMSGGENLQGPCLPDGSRPFYHVVGYVIKDNDTLQSILDFFNITLADLMTYNKLDQIMLKPGTVLQIPKWMDD